MDQSKGLRYRAQRLWYIYIITVNRTLTALFLLSVLVLFAHDIFFAGWPELFTWGGELWDLFYQLCLAFAASYIFYFVVVHIRRQREKDNLRPYLRTKTMGVYGRALSITNYFRNESGHEFEGELPPSEADTQSMCEAIHPYGQSPVLRTINPRAYLTWLELLVSEQRASRELIADIYTLMPFLDSDYLQLLVDVENCTHFMVMEDVLSHPLRNSDLTAFAPALHDYFEKVTRMSAYAEHNFDQGATR